ncbi:hypothetical protein OIU77_002047 [Salix suchowensis]|uniref:Oxidoreductase N-terminal domain-containing protein n=1 Tax=Salix suchowensis TaxID=1278906 RepID=A0ABQ9B5R2_9ROSI|nr:hypothetical protein OIU77_002047 [Salix suchowensis]
MESGDGEVVSNKQVIFKDYAPGALKESDMYITTSTIKLKVPEDCTNGVLVKNLYLSCDPYMRNRMRKLQGSYIAPLNPGSPVSGRGVAKVLDSRHPDYKKGDFIWGLTGWEEYSLITATETLFKIHDKDVPTFLLYWNSRPVIDSSSHVRLLICWLKCDTLRPDSRHACLLLPLQMLLCFDSENDFTILAVVNQPFEV